MPVGSNIEYILRTVQERGVTFIRLWYGDVQGTLKGIAFPVSELETVIEHGIGVDGSALEGGARLSELDVVARPDISTFQVLPWRDNANVGRMYSALQMPDGTPFDGDPRAALHAVMERAKGLGYQLSVGAEMEFYLFKPLTGDGPPELRETGTYFDLTPTDIATDFRRTIIEFLEQLGISLKASYHEAGPSQHEVVLKHDDPNTIADAIMTFRMAVKQAAINHDAHASFMPKPLAGQPGTGMHLHLSLFDDDDRNVFHDETDPARPLSPIGEQFVAGLLIHAPEMALVTNQWVNSYTRLADGFEAPSSITWSRRHPNPLVRIPGRRPDRPQSARVELRSPDGGANPYLVLAMVLAAGLRGIERGYALPLETPAGGADGRPLPKDLAEAIDVFADSEFALETLGPRIVEWLLANKRREWDAYRRTVSEFERQTYLPLL
ncbi:MAG: glutamine synthetase family protein [Solirubrobacteraceae bacterium]|nr:glutamine synthetase family protein [Solirubrobacteraceae bacterium]